MRKYFYLLTLCISLSIFSSCQNTAEHKKIESTSLQPLPQEIKQNLMANCDYIDYTFYNFHFSMSQAEPIAIKANIALLIDDVQPNIPADCKPIGRKYYHINGEIVMEAELYFSENCFFYIYKDDHTTLYGNKLSPQGINFYNNIIVQASKAGQQATG